jgi:hypothetical protein
VLHDEEAVDQRPPSLWQQLFGRWLIFNQV